MKQTMGWPLITTVWLAIAIFAFAQDISTDGNCGGRSNTNATCLTSTFGDCCSSNGYCGSTDVYCGADCQEAYGTCYANASRISSDGRCGQQDSTARICLQSTFGPCCSETGWCGNNSTYCGTGCQSDFGECIAVTPTTGVPATTSSDIAVTNGSKTTDGVGFKVGMAFVGIAAASIISGLIFFLMRRKKSSTGRQSADVVALEKGTEDDAKQLPPPLVLDQPQELNSSPVQEMSTDYNKARDEKKLLHNGPHELQ